MALWTVTYASPHRLKLKKQTKSPVASIIKQASHAKSILERDLATGEAWIDLMPKPEFQGWHEYRWPPGDHPVPFASVSPQWKVKDKQLSCSGAHHAILLTERNYRDFIFHVEYRYTIDKKDSSNSGIFVRMSPENRVMYQIELKGSSGEFFGGVLENGVSYPFMSLRPGENGEWARGRVKIPRDWKKSRETQIEPPVPDAPPELGVSRAVKSHGKGQWNTVEITCVDNVMIVWMNGSIVAYTDQCRIATGAVGFEAEGYQITFRNIKLKLLTK